ncbi:hypothetical protein llap_3627 [Limosa lapponica baueri]|uniref:Uncharacterized protein n=1 Tax=Limosa lapponica baueri TaxID=1758121 RepID=A0A2I0UJ78_LIMLA|nr:hypothetical protein llap_3627 [Limosa lapponica baueri]
MSDDEFVIKGFCTIGSKPGEMSLQHPLPVNYITLCKLSKPHQCQVHGDDHFPSPAGRAIPDTGQDAFGLLGQLGTLLAYIQLAVNQYPEILFCWAAFQPLFPKPVVLHGVVVIQVQDPALGLVEPHTTGLGPSIQPVQILM